MKKLTQEIILTLGTSAKPEDFEIKLDELIANRLRDYSHKPESVAELLQMMQCGIEKGNGVPMAANLGALNYALKALEIEI